MPAPIGGARWLFARVRERRKCRERGVQKPAEPDAFAPAVFSDAIHAVVPVARADERQAVVAACETLVERPRAMFEQ